MSQTKKNVLFVIAEKGLSTALFVLSGIIVARVLPTSDIGLIVLVTTVTGLTDLFRNLGLSSALLQRKTVNENMLNTVFWFNFAVGLVLFIIVFSLSPVIASFYEEPRLQNLLRLASINFVITPFFFVHDVLLRRSLNFKFLSICKLLTDLSSTLLCIALVLSDVGIVSLLYALITNVVIWLIALNVKIKWYPKWYFNIKYMKLISNFGTNFTLQKIVDYSARNLDNILIGKALGSSVLGLYSRAYQLMLLPIMQLVSSLRDVLFSTLSRVNDNNLEISRVYIKAVGTISFFTFPLYGLSWCLSTEGILFIYGEKWIPSAAIFDNLVIAALAQAFGILNNTIYSVKNKMNHAFRLSLFMLFLSATAFAAGIYFGNIELLAGLYSVASVIVIIPSFIFVKKLIHFDFKMLKNAISPNLIVAFFATALTFTLKHVLIRSFDLSNLALILICVPFFILIYFGLWRLFLPKKLLDNLDILPQSITPKAMKLFRLNN